MTNKPIEKLDPNFAQAAVEGDVRWYDVRDFCIEGQGWPDTESPFDRLPARAKAIVRADVWHLSLHSSGLSVRFITDAPTINARWRLRFPSFTMTHMPASGVSGLDLYVRHQETWHWVGVGRPEKVPDSEACLVSGLDRGRHEYQLYFPLYNGVERVAIGIPLDAFIGPAPKRPEGRHQPICFYGTSITQGGCAARPGMAYPAIIGRRLDRAIINLGFSGNGLAEPEIARLLAELDPVVYVINCLPNMDSKWVNERIEYMVTTLRNSHPQTPIVMVECLRYQNEDFVAAIRERIAGRTAAMKGVYERLCARGLPGLHYVKADNLLGRDGEGTVDGIHATDLGFTRIADVFTPVLKGLVCG
ncbi:MAG: SGNH/GDSL hydrolase family protein [Lentisphaerae bacterium]|nr:SGNH/GDSL hydrolase family protein [Lentisphaerota bacterium]